MISPLRKPEIVLAIIAILGIPIFMVSIWDGFQIMKVASKQSAQYSLFKEIVDQLEVYKDEHGEYPDKLDVLKFQYFEGGDPSLLSLFQYQSDGMTYTLHSIGIATNSELSAHSTEGKPHVEWGKPSDSE